MEIQQNLNTLAPMNGMKQNKKGAYTKNTISLSARINSEYNFQFI